MILISLSAPVDINPRDLAAAGGKTAQEGSTSPQIERLAQVSIRADVLERCVRFRLRYRRSMQVSVSWAGGDFSGVSRLMVGMGVSLALMGAASAQSTPPKAAVPALYPTRAEAEQASKTHFHCTGAHPMGNQWMPCAQHGPAHHSSHP